MFKKFYGDIDSVYYQDLDNYDDDDNNYDDDEYRKIGSIRRLFKKFDRDYYKPVRIDGCFAGINNKYMEYVSTGDRSENLSPEECLNMIRPYLRDLINEHISTMELNNNDDNNNNSNNNNDNNNNDNNNNNNNNNNNDKTDRADWKIQLTMQNSCISTKRFDETRTMYDKNEPVEICMGSDTENVFDTLLNLLLQKFQRAQETSNERGSKFFPDSVELLYYYFQRI